MRRARSDHIILHCSDSEFGNAVTIDRWHRERGMSSIGYHFIIASGRAHRSEEYNRLTDGAIETGRAIEEVGAHARAEGMNRRSIGICLIGKNRFTTKQFASAMRLILALMEQFPEISIERALGHCEVDPNKTCPNIQMEALRDRIRRKMARRPR